MLTSTIQEEILKYCVSNKNSVESTYREKDHLSLGGNKEGFSEGSFERGRILTTVVCGI